MRLGVMSLIDVLIVDDERNVRRAYEADIVAASDRYRLVDSLASARDAVMVCRARSVDLVLMDVNTAHHENGLDATRLIKEMYPKIKVLIHTSYLDDDILRDAKAHGADGLWFKDYSPESLLEVMDMTMRGEHYWPESMPAIPLGSTLLTSLTAGEKRVLRVLGECISISKMAERLCVEESTIKTHLHNLCMKTGCANKTELLVLAMEAKLFLPPETAQHTEEP